MKSAYSKAFTRSKATTRGNSIDAMALTLWYQLAAVIKLFVWLAKEPEISHSVHTADNEDALSGKWR